MDFKSTYRNWRDQLQSLEQKRPLPPKCQLILVDPTDHSRVSLILSTIQSTLSFQHDPLYSSDFVSARLLRSAPARSSSFYCNPGVIYQPSYILPQIPVINPPPIEMVGRRAPARGARALKDTEQ